MRLIGAVHKLSLMAISDWMRIIDTVGGLAQMSGKFRPKPSETGMAEPGAGPGGLAGGIEARLAGVVVAALKEAFDRDRARTDLERAQMEADRRRADDLLAAELRRQAAERTLSQLRLVAVLAASAWMLSAILAVWLPGMRGGLPRALLGAGWLLAFVSLGCTFAGSRLASSPAAGPPAGGGAAEAAPWALLAALGAIAASILTAL